MLLDNFGSVTCAALARHDGEILWTMNFYCVLGPCKNLSFFIQSNTQFQFSSEVFAFAVDHEGSLGKSKFLPHLFRRDAIDFDNPKSACPCLGECGSGACDFIFRRLRKVLGSLVLAILASTGPEDEEGGSREMPGKEINTRGGKV